ncbi:hypothetical protein [Bradyrhizobium sp. NBAIM14]|nr:hypothetical protein [Bradyrhizobium sp. NBAIM14]
MSVQKDALPQTSSGEQNDAAAECLPQKLDVDNNGANALQPR